MKNINKALTRFNKMYKEITSEKIIDIKGVKRLQIVKNYGLNFLALYPDTNFIDVKERVEALIKRESYLSFQFKF